MENSGIYSKQYSAPCQVPQSCPACTRSDRVVGAQNIVLTRNKLSKQNIFGDSSFFHSLDMSQLAQSALTKHREYSTSRQHNSVWCPAPP